MKAIILKLIFVGFIILGLTQCSKDDDKSGQISPTPTPTPTETRHLIGEATLTDLSVDIKLYADTTPFVGYNRIYTEINSSGKSGNNYDVEYLPEMDMGMMTHRCPIENPTLNSDNMYEGAVVFIMESAGMGDWTFEVKITDQNSNVTASHTFDLEVIAPEEARVFSFISELDAQPIFVTLIEPSKPFVGINDFEVAVHSRMSRNNFPPVEDLMIRMEPEMPTMGHGSPDNEDPMHVENGHYMGKVNFTMPGYWRVNMDFTTINGDVVKKGTSFDITF